MKNDSAKRAARRQRARARKVQEAARNGCLPMPVPADAPSKVEWETFKELRRLHDSGDWRRPTPEIAEKVWALVSRPLGLRDKDLLPWYPWSNASDLTDWPSQLEAAKQALTVALAAVVRCGRHGTMATANRVHDALARAWSD
jgi:hypothetical protein